MLLFKNKTLVIVGVSSKDERPFFNKPRIGIIERPKTGRVGNNEKAFFGLSKHGKKVSYEMFPETSKELAKFLVKEPLSRNGISVKLKQEIYFGDSSIGYVDDMRGSSIVFYSHWKSDGLQAERQIRMIFPDELTLYFGLAKLLRKEENLGDIVHLTQSHLKSIHPDYASNRKK